MMDLFNSLMALGSGGAASAAPTDMSQIKVPQQAMDLAGTIDAANSQLDFNQPQQGFDWDTAKKAGILALGSAVGGKPAQQEQMIQAPHYQGGGRPRQFKAEDISGMNRAALQQFAQAQGLLSR